EDREALLAEEAEHAAEEAALRAEAEDMDGDVEDMAAPAALEDEEGHEGEEGEVQAKPKPRSSDAAAEDLRRKRMALRRRYKIQDVIRRRQVMLVQVVKEERGNKGAALTTYLSLAGRYCVLMPNTSHGGGISRKISNAADRKRLKSIISELKLPSTMGCIVRTAGLQRTKPEIKRDFDYLARLWDEIRENTLRAAAPALIHNDSDLIKRAIRDIYNRDIEEVLVEGEDGYKAAKDFMKLLMPSHARRVKQYADAVSLFQRFGVEDQLAAMYHPVVQLKSGGYLVINPTEALVSIDINSGRSTREHGIEQTAVATNLEAAREIARQLKLRDMAGLVVIDFIDMEQNSNIRKVEKAMKEALKDDRARIQVGRISGFGLMEMSRQRLRTGVLEASTRECPHCEGTGLVRTASSAGLSALRLLEEEAARGRGSIITLRASQEAAFYVLNNKRAEIDEIETRYGVRITILPDGETEGARMSVEAAGPRPANLVSYAPIVEEEEEVFEEPIEEDAEEEIASERSAQQGEREDGGRRRRRRRRGRKGRREDHPEYVAEGESAVPEEAEEEAEAADEGQEPHEAVLAEEGEGRRRSRRGRRGGRRRRAGEQAAGHDEHAEPVEAVAEVEVEALPQQAEAEAAPEAATLEAVAPEVVQVAEEPAAEAEPRKTRRRPRARKEEAVEAPVADATAEIGAEAPVEEKPKRRRKAAPKAEAPAEAEAEMVVEKPKRTRRKKVEAEAVEPETAAPALAETAPEVAPVVEPAAITEEAAPATAEPAPANDPNGQAAEEEDGTPRRGWWQRTFGN
ncbi:MAG TPA: ribonuclease E/G, partial [Rhizorhapis sp.]|nr:ribonuclease E/G [Rhizorhapis sp.]